MESETVDFYKLLAKLRDFHAGIAEALDEYVQTKSKAVLVEYDPEKIEWTNEEGPKGPYQQTDDVNNPEYKALRLDLKDHNQKLMHKGYFYWVFSDGVIIGRKKLSH